MRSGILILKRLISYSLWITYAVLFDNSNCSSKVHSFFTTTSYRKKDSISSTSTTFTMPHLKRRSTSSKTLSETTGKRHTLLFFYINDTDLNLEHLQDRIYWAGWECIYDDYKKNVHSRVVILKKIDLPIHSKIFFQVLRFMPEFSLKATENGFSRILSKYRERDSDLDSLSCS